ncbi:MAG: GNAT family N-acetyltransferase [Micromonosporaceae bacterium]
MPDSDQPRILQHTQPADVAPSLRKQIIDCWVAVTNNGGAAGFPFPPIKFHHAAGATDALLTTLTPAQSRILTAHIDGTLAGWVHLHRDPNRLIAHWGSVHHLQTHPTHRRQGIGAALMQKLHQVARDELHLDQLHLAARGGAGLEHFYTRLGWREIGRWPAKLKLAPGDLRDEILMILNPL